MNGNCKDCVHVQHFNDRLDKIEETQNDQRQRITTLERSGDVEHERTTLLFKMLGDIQESIDKIGQRIEEVANKPDTFKEKVYDFGIKMVELGVMAGIVYLVMTKGGL